MSSADEVNDAIQALIAIDSQQVLEFPRIAFDEMEYEGFEPAKMLAHLIKKGKAAAPGSETIGGRTVQITSLEFIMNELSTIAFVAACRGNKITSKIIPKSSENAADWLGKMKNKYTIIESGTRKREFGKTDVTMARILACFAHIVLDAVHKGKLLPTITPMTIKNENLPPRVICCSVFGTLIPPVESWVSEAHFNTLLCAWLWHQSCFDNIINANHKVENVEKFALIQLRSTHIPDDMKEERMLTWGLALRDTSTKKLGLRDTDYAPGISEMAEKWKVESKSRLQTIIIRPKPPAGPSAPKDDPAVSGSEGSDNDGADLGRPTKRGKVEIAHAMKQPLPMEVEKDSGDEEVDAALGSQQLFREAAEERHALQPASAKHQLPAQTTQGVKTKTPKGKKSPAPK
nr:MAG: nucleocapsid protein [Fushun phenuivirus 1]UHR49865.1 MAG: nucleocapsid protein [Fushun hierodula formosana phenuivirus 1]UHR49872.1 MAG: nucleocapsid protein [Fushun hierodula formosana phenuivirus 1]